MGIPEKLKSRPDIVPVRNENFKNAVQVFDRRPTVEFHDSVESLEGLVW